VRQTRNGETAGGAAGTPDKLEAREAEAGMRNGRGEADLGAHTGTGKKTPWGAGTHTGYTGTHGHTRRITQTNRSQPSQPSNAPAQQATTESAAIDPRPTHMAERYKNFATAYM